MSRVCPMWGPVLLSIPRRTRLTCTVFPASCYHSNDRFCSVPCSHNHKTSDSGRDAGRGVLSRSRHRLSRWARHMTSHRKFRSGVDDPCCRKAQCKMSKEATGRGTEVLLRGQAARHRLARLQQPCGHEEPCGRGPLSASLLFFVLQKQQSCGKVREKQ